MAVLQIYKAHLRGQAWPQSLTKLHGREQPPSAASLRKSPGACTSSTSSGCFLQRIGRAADTSEASSSCPMTLAHTLVVLVCLKGWGLPTSTMPCIALQANSSGDMATASMQVHTCHCNAGAHMLLGTSICIASD